VRFLIDSGSGYTHRRGYGYAIAIGPGLVFIPQRLLNLMHSQDYISIIGLAMYRTSQIGSARPLTPIHQVSSSSMHTTEDDNLSDNII
jgi:hypothetical protein